MNTLKELGNEILKIDWRNHHAENTYTTFENLCDDFDIYEFNIDELRASGFNDYDVAEIMQVYHIHTVLSMA